MNCSHCNTVYDNTQDYLCPSCGGIETMNLFNDVPNYDKFLKDLTNKTATLIDKLKTKGIDVNDIRRTKLGGFNILTLATLLEINDYEQDIRYNDSRIPTILKQNNPTMNNSMLLAVIENIDVRNRIAYLTISLFQFENLFVSLSKELGFTGNETYFNSVNYLIDNMNLQNKTEKKDTLILPSILRNTLHSSGIYKNRNDKNLKVKNISFKFVNGQIHTYTSWRMIIFCFNNIIEIIEEILDNFTSTKTLS